MWNNVKRDGLPAIGEKVLLCINGVVQKETFDMDSSDSSDWSPVMFWGRDDIDDCPLVDDEHWWMRLPSPPTAELVEGANLQTHNNARDEICPRCGGSVFKSRFGDDNYVCNSLNCIWSGKLSSVAYERMEIDKIVDKIMSRFAPTLNMCDCGCVKTSAIEEAIRAVLVEEKFTSTNSDYAAALRVYEEFVNKDMFYDLQNFKHYCEQRLNSAKAPNCA